MSLYELTPNTMTKIWTFHEYQNVNEA